MKGQMRFVIFNKYTLNVIISHTPRSLAKKTVEISDDFRGNKISFLNGFNTCSNNNEELHARDTNGTGRTHTQSLRNALKILKDL